MRHQSVTVLYIFLFYGNLEKHLYAMHQEHGCASDFFQKLLQEYQRHEDSVQSLTEVLMHK